MDVVTGERTSMAGTMVAETLDREQGVREAREELNQRLNQARPDVPMPAPGALGQRQPKLSRPEQREITEMGGLTNYGEYFAGEHEPRAVVTDEEKNAVVKRWEQVSDEEVPYDLNNPLTGEAEYQLMLRDLQRRVLRSLSEPVEGYEGGPVALSEAGVVIETGVDIPKIRNRRIRETLKGLGGEDFVRNVWTNASEIVLAAPANEKAGWVMQLVGKPGEDGRRKLLAMTLSDWERMLVVRDDSGGEREVRLPDPGNGSYEKALPLVRALFKLNFRGKGLPRDVKLSREFLN